MIKDRLNIKKEDEKMLNSIYWRTMTLSSTYNYEKMQALGYIYSMIPVIKRQYKEKQEQVEALKRHNEIFNTTEYIMSTHPSTEKRIVRLEKLL